MLLLSSLLFSLATYVYAQDTSVPTVVSALQSSKVIPDVLPANFTPKWPIEVVFHDSATNQSIPVTAGMNLSMSETLNIPTFSILSNITQIIGKPYLIAMVDPDAPSPPNRNISQFLHFLGINYISNAITDGDLFLLNNNTAPLVPYVNPTPPNGSVPHRYIIAMYLQASNNVTVVNGTIPANREGFNLTTFVEKTGNLTLLGATFFFVGPGNSTANNTVTGNNATLSSVLVSSATGTSPASAASSSAGTKSGGAISLDFVAPAIWSVLATLFGTAIYFL